MASQLRAFRRNRNCLQPLTLNEHLVHLQLLEMLSNVYSIQIGVRSDMVAFIHRVLAIAFSLQLLTGFGVTCVEPQWGRCDLSWPLWSILYFGSLLLSFSHSIRGRLNWRFAAQIQTWLSTRTLLVAPLIQQTPSGTFTSGPGRAASHPPVNRWTLLLPTLCCLITHITYIHISVVLPINFVQSHSSLLSLIADKLASSLPPTVSLDKLKLSQLFIAR